MNVSKLKYTNNSMSLVSKNISRSKRTMLNAFFNSLSLLISTVLQLVAVRTILLFLGSDYNGINGTINSFLSMLMIIESGFTLATLVKIYKPYGENDYYILNKYLSKTNEIFKKIGTIMFVVGLITAAIYGIFIKTSIDYWTVYILFAFSITSMSFNFFYTYKYRLIYQVSQSEYVLYINNIVLAVISNIGMILLIRFTKDIIIARGYYAFCYVLNGILIALMTKHFFPKASFQEDSTGATIEGTNDLLVSKISTMLYGSITVFYMATFVGTLQTSVYAVYDSVILVVSQFTSVFMSSPLNALGQIINTEKERLKSIFAEYNYIAVLVVCLICPTTLALMIPFVRIYTAGVTDVNYIQPWLSTLLLLILVTQLIHIPSGHSIELSGRFTVVKKIQLMTLVLILILSTIGGIFWGIIGLLSAKLITNVILASVEIFYAHRYVAVVSLQSFLRMALPNLLFALIFTIFEAIYLYNKELTLLQFLISSIILQMLNVIFVFAFNYCCYNSNFNNVIKRIRVVLNKKF